MILKRTSDNHDFELSQQFNTYFLASHGMYFDVNGDRTSDAFVITAGENVGIGTLTPSHKLHVLGS